MTPEPTTRTDVVQLRGSNRSFAALRRDGEIVTWGDPDICRSETKSRSVWVVGVVRVLFRCCFVVFGMGFKVRGV